MSTRSDVLDQHLKCFAKLTDGMVSIEAESLLPAAWVDIEDVLSDEWDIGAPAMTTDAIRALVAGEYKTLEEI